MYRYMSHRSLSAARTGIGQLAERQNGLVTTSTPFTRATRNSSDYNEGRRTRSVNHTQMVIAAAGAAATGYYLWKKYTNANYSLKDSAYSVVQSLIPVVHAEEPEASGAVVAAAAAEEGGQPQAPALPSHVPYLIIGSGTAAFTAYKAIRAGDAKAKVLMVGEEQHVPYMRPPLSKEMWFTDDRKLIEELKVKMWGGKERSIFYEKDTFFCAPHELSSKETGGVALLRGRKVVKLDVDGQLAVLDDGAIVKYDKCLIATGGKPKSLPIFQAAGPEIKERTTLFRTIEDFKQLDSVAQSAGTVAIIGGSFMGSELAVGLATRGKSSSLKVIQLFPENGNMGRTLPPYLSNWTTDRVRAIGVDVRPKTSVKSVSFDEGSKKVALTLDNGQTLKVDHVILSVGIEPATELAGPSGLEIDSKFGGFLVNAELEARRNVWVAGDVASFYDVKLGRRRVEHHDHAIVSGRLAGENMTGGGKPYWHQSMFWSDLGPEVGYEAIGIIDSSLQTFAAYRQASADDTPQAASQDGELRSETEEKKGHKELSVVEVSKPDDGSSNYGKGVIFYLRDGYIVGVVMWNIFGKMSIARKLINEDQKFEDFTDVARLFFQPEEAKS